MVDAVKRVSLGQAHGDESLCAEVHASNEAMLKNVRLARPIKLVSVIGFLLP
jgi:hypothetical protein